MSKANAIAVGLTVVAVLIALWLVKMMDKNKADKTFS